MKHGGAGWSGTSAITCFLSEAYRERRLASGVFVSRRDDARTSGLCLIFPLCLPMYFPFIYVFYIFPIYFPYVYTYLYRYR